MAERLRRCFREEDTVARLGGDEFGALEPPFRIAGTDVHASASIGMAYSSPELRNPEDLLRFSDVAVYRAEGETGTSKRSGVCGSTGPGWP